ncbi:hypothetical protein V8G54_022378 [Vigna mungo]|uniref:BRCT domain-containing protein n=1 Tax=Vigna mungo TaxID=3915 RepID=A0AAQ3RWN5_VIGMU
MLGVIVCARCEKEEVTVCARCHSLRNYGQVKNQTVENLIPDFDFNRLISTRLMNPSGSGSATVVVMVVDCVDFDGSFPRIAVKSLFQALERIQDNSKRAKKLPKLVLVATKVDLLPSQVLSSRKYRTLLVKSTRVGNSGKVIAAITYQIIPADTEFAEVPLAAVNAIHQRKGFGHLLVLELRKRLQSVGIRSILCWGDKESEGFWLKQGFVEIAQVDTKGRARRLPVKADIQKSLCFLGGSTLMVCHVMKECLADEDNTTKCLPSQFHQNPFTPAIAEDEQLKISGSDSRNPKKFCSSIAPFAQVNDDRQATGSESSQDGVGANVNYCSQSTKAAKRTWEASLSSLKSKRVKGSQLVDNQSGSSCGFILETDEANPCFVEAVYDPSITDGSEKYELLHILNDTDYSLKYKCDLKSAVLRAKASSHTLFKGYNICIAAHVQTPAKTLSAIVMSAGGNVISRVEKVKETSTTIFVTGEEDTEEAMVAAKKGIRTFSCDWFMNCVMRQELDLEAPQFAETL